MAQPKGDFTAVQLVATVLATVTGAVLASSLGVVGTVTGSAIASGVSTSATFLYRHYLNRTSERIRAVAPALVQRTRGRAAPRADSTPTPPERMVVVGAGEEIRRLPAAAGRITLAADGAPADPPRKPRRRLSRRALLAYWGLALGAFILVMACVTVVELAAGKPLPSVVWGKSGSGTSIGNTFSGGRSTSTKPSPATTHPTGGASTQPTGSSSATAPASQSPSATPSPTAPASTGATQQSPEPTGPTASDPGAGTPAGTPAG